jgi:hypothetical protein
MHEAFTEAVIRLDPGIAETVLVCGLTDTSLRRIITLWESREALDTMRRTGETPRGVLNFRRAGTKPILSVSEVVNRAVAGE